MADNDYEWIEQYKSDVEAEVEKLRQMARQSYGDDIDFVLTFEPCLEARCVMRLGGQIYSGYGSGTPVRINRGFIQGKQKPKLLAKNLVRRNMWSLLTNRNCAPLRHRESYLRNKLRQQQHNYSRWDAAQLEVPPTTLERTLHPGVAANVRRLLAATEGMSPPPVYSYGRGATRIAPAPGVYIPTARVTFNPNVEDRADDDDN